MNNQEQEELASTIKFQALHRQTSNEVWAESLKPCLNQCKGKAAIGKMFSHAELECTWNCTQKQQLTIAALFNQMGQE